VSKLEGKVAVITGGSSGIGLATAKRFVEEGAYVFITGRRQAELDKAKALIGKNVTAVQGDASVLEDLDRLYRVVKETMRRRGEGTGLDHAHERFHRGQSVHLDPSSGGPANHPPSTGMAAPLT